jgi:hypothetical protein
VQFVLPLLVCPKKPDTMGDDVGAQLWGQESGKDKLMDGMVENESVCPNLSLKKVCGHVANLILSRDSSGLSSVV